MKVELKVPEVGESVQEALLAEWLKKDGQKVRKDEVLFVIETDKVTLEISAPSDGVLSILVGEGNTVAVGTVVGMIETEAAEVGMAAPAPAPEKPAERPRPPAVPQAPPLTEQAVQPVPAPELAEPAPLIAPSARALAEERGIDLADVPPSGPGGRITEGDVRLFLEQQAPEKPIPKPPGREIPVPPRPAQPAARAPVQEGTVRKPMSPIRLRIAERLLDARRNTAMLTTFNEIDMSRLQAIRQRFGEEFKQKHGIKLGMMSFFIEACLAALKQMPEVNAFIEGNDIVYHNYYNIGVAVGAQRGLVVPVIRDADKLGFAGLERAIVDFVKKINENRLELSDLEGGTFTITNGGIFGSLLSTPILNPPQSAILGMHKVEDRPVVVNGQITVRPMMYVALSYDHRLIDGREAVTFLLKVKECIEDPERIMMEL